MQVSSSRIQVVLPCCWALYSLPHRFPTCDPLPPFSEYNFTVLFDVGHNAMMTERRHSGPCNWVLRYLALQQLSYESPLPWQSLLQAANAEPTSSRHRVSGKFSSAAGRSKQQGHSFASSQNLCNFSAAGKSSQFSKVYMGQVLGVVIPVVWINCKNTTVSFCRNELCLFFFGNKAWC